ncbi:MAG: hypothetical protein J6S71_10130 [Clostridia bacterium]|nr:hypothetical protein [Clostridia bacterium]
MKKKILAVALAAIMLLIAITGASLAYLTDKDDQVNTFTSGKVDITLDEAKVTLDADKYISGYTGRTSEDQNYGKMFPGQVITKDPTITVAADSEKAYVAAKVTVTATDLQTLIGIPGTDLIDINKLASGGLMADTFAEKPTHPLAGGTLPVFGNDKYSIYQEKDGNAYVFYIFIETIKAPGESVTLFDTITIPTAWTNADMAKIVDLKVTVDAYAVQVQTFADCFDAMTTAFATDFSFAP